MMYYLPYVFLFLFSGVLENSADSENTFELGSVPGEFVISSNLLQGVLRQQGRSIGLHPLLWSKGETMVSGPMGLFNYYRIFTTNHRFGESMRALPSEAERVNSTTVKTHWPSTEERPFNLTGIYTWVSAGIIDLITIVEARSDLSNFDVFLASYLSPEFPVSTVCIKDPSGKPKFELVEEKEGIWQAFPRDMEAVSMIKDGRWAIGPSPVDWAVRPEYAVPIIYRRHEKSKLAVIQMAQPEDCIAMFSPYRGETHYSMYFSLFGRSLRAGETTRTRVRLIIGEYDETEILSVYEDFINSVQPK